MIKFNAAEMSKITDAKISFKGNQFPQLNFSIKDDNIFVGVENGFAQIMGEIKIDSTVSTTVQFSLPYNLTNEIFNKFGKKGISLEYDEKEITLRDEKYKFKILPYAAGFNSILENINGFKADNSIEFPMEVFKNVIGKVAPFVSPNQIKPVLRGVNIAINSGKIDVAATDGKRLSHFTITDISTFNASENSNGSSMTIDDNTLNKIAEETKTAVKVQWNQSTALFDYNNIKLMIQLIEGKFPDYRKVVPADFKNKTSIDKKEILEAISFVGVILKNGMDNRAHRVKMDFTQDGINICTKSDKGESKQRSHTVTILITIQSLLMQNICNLF
jgi:DNA polymerase-3 subunit beta